MLFFRPCVYISNGHVRLLHFFYILNQSAEAMALSTATKANTVPAVFSPLHA